MTQPAEAVHAASPVDPLLELLAACVVRIDRDGRFSGTGFLVAPGEVLTCAHVVHGGLPLTVTLADNTTHTAEPSTPLLAADDPAARFYPYPDAALLRFDAAPEGHPSVRLDSTAAAEGDRFQLCGFTQGEHAQNVVVRSGAALRVETLLVEDGHTLVKFREGQVIGGFSGGPLLNRRTGAVAAIVESTRSPTTALGGYGVPISEIVAALDPDLTARNTAALQGGWWARAVEAQATLEAERAGQRDLLPLLDAIVPLDPGEDVAPSELLRPRHAVVPFVARGDLLEQIMRWRETDTPLSVLVLAGGGGFGKTRTALEICRHAEQAGWIAGPIDADEAGTDGLNQLTTWPGRLLIAVDYAETRPDLVTALLRRLRRRRVPAPCRVVLVVRQRADRQTLIDLFTTGDAADDIAALLRRAEWVGLGVGEHELDRRALFDTALTAFTTGDDRRVVGVDLYAEHFARPLFVLAAALLAAQDPDLDIAALSENQLLGQILDRHEARYWQRADTRLGLGLHPDDQRVAVALMATAGLWSDTADTALVRLVPALADASNERVALVVRWLRSLYGTTGTLEPDLLGEVLIARALTAEPDLAAAVLATTDHDQLVRALLVLSRAAYRSEAARVAVRDALDPRLPDLAADAHHAPPDLVAALILTVTATQPVGGAARAQFRVQPLTALAGQLALALGEVAVDGLRAASDSGTTDSAAATDIRRALAAALVLQSSHLSETGYPTLGLLPIEEAVRLYRSLADADPSRFLPDLAGALNNQSNRYADAGRPGDGLAPVEEAVGIRRALAEADPTRFLPDLATALNNQSSLYAEAGRPGEGLAAIEEAVRIRRTQAEADPTRFLPDLATALNNKSGLYAEAGRPGEGLAPIDEATRLYRALAEADPTRFLPDLATALNNQSILYARSGHPGEGLAPIEEAVHIRRAQTGADPTRFLPDLAMALNNQSIHYADAGSPGEGLPAIEEAVRLYRALAEGDPTRFLPDLAGALGNQSNRYAQAGRPVEGVAPIEEAVRLYRTLAEGDPTRFLPDLAGALNNQSSIYADAGHPGEGLAAIEEAVRLRRTLAEGDPTRFLPALAQSLNNQSNRYADAGRPGEGLAAIDEAVRIRRALAEADPTRFLPNLATSLNNQSNRYADAGRPAEGLAPIDEAVRIRRALAQADPTRFLPDLATALNNQSNRYAQAGRPAEGLAPIEEADQVYRTLAEADPTRFLPNLVTALTNHAARLTQLGRPQESARVFDEPLDHWDTPAWPRAVLLLGRAELLADTDPHTAARDAVAATELAEQAGDRARRGRARQLLRRLHTTHPDTVTQAWTHETADPLPIWLRLPDDDPGTAQLVIDWINTTSWDDSFTFLTDHTDRLLTDTAEATLEHLTDANPHAAELDQHLTLLRAARTDGIDTVHQELLDQQNAQHLAALLETWIATESWQESADYLTEHTDDLLTDTAEQFLTQSVGDQPQLLVYLGLLALARDLNVATAHAYITDPATLDNALQTATGDRLLHLARLNAGLHPDSATAHLHHALAATALDDTDEAAWAAHRSRDVSASWERQSLITQIQAFAAEHPALDLTPVLDALTEPETPAEPDLGGMNWGMNHRSLEPPPQAQKHNVQPETPADGHRRRLRHRS